jgi:Protein of unknown function (DUF4235)
MSKLLFIPFSVIGGMLAGMLGKKTFAAVWGAIDDHEPPDAQHRDVSFAKLIAALVLEGAILRAVRGLFDHGTRQAFHKLTGSWPGDEHPEPA